jgi:hypothetical protein
MPPSIDTTPKVPPSTGNVADGVGLLENAGLLWREWSGLARDRLHLAALKTKLAGQSFVTMIAAGVIGGVLLVSAWLGLVAAAILTLVDAGMIASIAMLLGVLANVVLALLMYCVIRRKSRHLRWPASIGSLGPLPTTMQRDTGWS